MAFGRGNMGKEMTGNRVKKMRDGGGLAMISPAAALAQSVSSGSPQGLLKLSPLAMAARAVNGDDERKKRREEAMAQGKKMAGGGAVKASRLSGMRGCGVAKRGTSGGKMV